MAAQSTIFLCVLVLTYICSFYFLANGKALVKRFENCDPNKSYKAKINVTLKSVGDKQYVDGNFVLATNVDNHIRANVSIEMLVGKEYVYLFSINEKKPCEALNKYFGEMWHDIERNAQLIPGLCPIPKGKYYVHNLLVNFEKMTTVSYFPFGNLRITCMAYDNKNSIYTCVIAETETHM